VLREPVAADLLEPSADVGSKLPMLLIALLEQSERLADDLASSTSLLS
jgi:hypothetical protein